MNLRINKVNTSTIRQHLLPNNKITQEENYTLIYHHWNSANSWSGQLDCFCPGSIWIIQSETYCRSVRIIEFERCQYSFVDVLKMKALRNRMRKVL